MIMIGTNMSDYKMNNMDMNRKLALAEELNRLNLPPELLSSEPLDDPTKNIVKAYLQKRIEEIEHHGC